MRTRTTLIQRGALGHRAAHRTTPPLAIGHLWRRPKERPPALSNCLHAGKTFSLDFGAASNLDCRRHSSRLAKFMIPRSEGELPSAAKKKGGEALYKKSIPTPLLRGSLFNSNDLDPQPGAHSVGRALCAPASIAAVRSRCSDLRLRPSSLSRRRRPKAGGRLHQRKAGGKSVSVWIIDSSDCRPCPWRERGIIYPPLRTARSLGFL